MVLVLAIVSTQVSGMQTAQETPSQRFIEQELEQQLPGFRVAAPADFVEELRATRLVPNATQSLLRADFDGDGRRDLAIVVVDAGRAEYGIYYVLTTEAGARFVPLLSQVVTGPTADGIVRNAMFLKVPGQAGVAARTYRTLPGTIPRSEYQAAAAIEVWTGPARVDAKDQRNFPDGGIAYCSRTWYFRPNGNLETFGACD
jgi:hypothetical protein